MVRLAVPVACIALLAAPALARSYRREDAMSSDEVFARALTERVAQYSREELEDIFGREFIADIEEREPFLGFLFKGIKAAVRIGKKIHSAVQAKHHHDQHKRDLEELEGGVWAREFDEMLERSLLFDGEDLEERDYFYDEMD